MSNDDEIREQVEEDAKEDLVLEDEDAEKVAGGLIIGDIKGESLDDKHRD